MKKLLVVLAFITAFAFTADGYLIEDTVDGGTGTDFWMMQTS